MQKRSVVWVGSAVLAVGCGAVPQASKPQPSTLPEEPAPTTIDEAEASLERGRARLSKLEAKKETPPKPADMPPKDPVAPAPTAPQNKNNETASPASGSDMCHDVCRTLASMRRAADTICRLAGPEDARCQGARRKVQEGEERASPCGCRPAVS